MKEEGVRRFGTYMLKWETVDREAVIHWTLTDQSDRVIRGTLKYVGWNRFDNENSANGFPVEIYQHNWPAFRAAMDFIYGELLPSIDSGTNYGEQEGEFWDAYGSAHCYNDYLRDEPWKA